MARWRGEARARLLAGNPNRVVFCFGANDTALVAGSPRATPAASATALAGGLTQAATWRLPAFVIGPPPVGDAAQHGRIRALEVAFADVCREHGVPFIAVCDRLLDDATWSAEARAGDGAHPGAGGYVALARLVLEGGFVEWLRG